ncbi:UDP-N-acetylglucosamine--dolichyl-phosphate N-acetylglucosaminyltransferase [Candidatus Burarchaeum australiense]|nr:UDP-N-acetylglucosamine--dolichyl-phosphate N-acetylglucosaminyltransferase [Candidatus Burarchaeum australiense]
MAGKKIVIYIPTYNVAHTLPNVLDRIPPELKKRASELLVIDNASSDNTYLTAVQYKADKRLHNMHVIKNERNLGYGGSQKKAYQYAIDHGYDIIVMLHGDAQYAPEKVPLILKPLENDEADFVFGSRMAGNPLGGGMPLWRYFGNRVITFCQNLVLGLHLSEYHSGFRAFSCKALKKIPFQRCADDYHFDTDILIQFRLADMRIAEEPIPTHYGKESRSPTVLQTVNYTINIFIALFEYMVHRLGIRKVAKFDF